MHRDVYAEVYCCSFLILSLTALRLFGVYGRGIRHSVCTRAEGWHNVYWSTSVKLHTRQQRALKRWEQIRAHEQCLTVAHVSQEVLEGGKGRQLRCETDVSSCILVSPGLSRPLEKEIRKSKALSSQFQSFYKEQNYPNKLENNI